MMVPGKWKEEDKESPVSLADGKELAVLAGTLFLNKG